MSNCATTLNAKQILSNEDKNRINAISGSTTPLLIDTIWEMSDHDGETLLQFITLLTTLYEQSQYETMISIIRFTHGIMGLKMPAPVEQLVLSPEALQFYLQEFLLDIDDIIFDYAE